MKIQAHMIISDRGAIRVVKQRPYLNNDEIAVKLSIDVPNEFFERMIPVVDIALPADAVSKPEVESSVAVTADTVAKALRLDVTDVYDGLTDMLARAKEKKTS